MTPDSVHASPRAVVVGAGISGIACAQALRLAGVQVEVLDRGRAIGGRMASRRLPRATAAHDADPQAGHITDIGASYFTVRDPAFAEQVQALVDAGVVHPWTDGFGVYQDGRDLGRRTGPLRYSAPAGLRSVVEALAADLTVAQGTEVAEVYLERDGALSVDRERVDAVALCMPGPQADRLLAGPHPGASAARQAASAIAWESVIAVSAGFAEVGWQPFDGIFVNGDPTLTWIADDGARRGNGAPVLVAHVAPALAASMLQDPEQAREPAIAALRRVLSIRAEPQWVDVQRWTYARPTGARDEPCYLDGEVNLGMAGDAWAGGPRVEAAWCSGLALGQALASRLS